MRRFLIIAALAGLASPALGQATVVSACGAKTFAVGSVNYVTMNPQGYLCVSTTTLLERSPPTTLPEEAPAKDLKKDEK